MKTCKHCGKFLKDKDAALFGDGPFCRGRELSQLAAIEDPEAFSVSMMKKERVIFLRALKPGKYLTTERVLLEVAESLRVCLADWTFIEQRVYSLPSGDYVTKINLLSLEPFGISRACLFSSDVSEEFSIDGILQKVELVQKERGLFSLN